MSHSRTDSRKARRAGRLARRTAGFPLPRLSLLLSLLTTGILAGPVPPAEAATGYGAQAVAVAASKEGAPYARGATGPKRFDCSGLTLYSFRQAGRRLPRTAEQQYEQTAHISRKNRAPGDLVFFPRGATVEHVGIYAGHDKIWHAPRPGTRVRLERIWSRDVRYGRAD
ncbi:C40 family peptidase [Streptomyces subrutilus]|uniref:Glycoside hydrolase n=1 Tax=Streptomyces subrutilus TaxID=36818 RepID=A0A5P2UFL8_9ACTN|nr:C40 family peptidase [Streptomyces subrutilus]QEU77245.1 NlpC/P60 family protein [Streptomyces subrutilus]WSJ33774.1 C40 family peptidase [Streptomyces subrutilus]GGZ45833.1 glycoside hydrolase [Streptomyces subrutilus]